MIVLSKLNGEEFVLNSDLIEMIMENPDTTILLTNGKHLIVRESKEEVVERVAAFRRKTFSDLDVYKRQYPERYGISASYPHERCGGSTAEDRCLYPPLRGSGRDCHFEGRKG